MRLLILQHVPFEGPGAIAAWAEGRGHTLRTVHLYRGECPPGPEEFDLLVVMGGPMGVHDRDRHGWLVTEKRFLERALAAGRPALGICLGAQLLADVLGARVYRNRHKEIGWFPVYPAVAPGDTLAPEAAAAPDETPAAAPAAIPGPEAKPAVRSPALPSAPFTAFHWHGDTFDIPAGSRLLAGSDATPHQAFLHGDQVLGLQFHLECTAKGVERLLAHCAGDLTPGPYVQGAAAIREGLGHGSAARAILYGLLEGWEELNRPRAKRVAL